MKAILNLDQDADASALPEEYVAKLKFRFHGGDAHPYFPRGTEFEGDHALHLCRSGQASPADDECSKALGLSVHQQKVGARKYLAAVAGIKGPKDMELFMSGVIEGYVPETTDEKPVYLPGPNYAAWEAAKAKLATEDDVE